MGLFEFKHVTQISSYFSKRTGFLKPMHKAYLGVFLCVLASFGQRCCAVTLISVPRMSNKHVRRCVTLFYFCILPSSFWKSATYFYQLQMRFWGQNPTFFCLWGFPSQNQLALASACGRLVQEHLSLHHNWAEPGSLCWNFCHRFVCPASARDRIFVCATVC